jgi:hypothetical protein
VLFKQKQGITLDLPCNIHSNAVCFCGCDRLGGKLATGYQYIMLPFYIKQLRRLPAGPHKKIDLIFHVNKFKGLIAKIHFFSTNTGNIRISVEKQRVSVLTYAGLLSG